MRRVLITVFASLLALALIGPAAAQGATKYRYWQDLSVSGPFPGQINLAIAYEDRNGNGKFKPRSAVSYNLQVQASCNPGGEIELQLGGNAFAKYNYFVAGISKGRFAHRFGSEQPESSTLEGDLNGTVLKKQKQGKRVTRTARVNGAFDVEDWDLDPGVTENCISSASYSATQCKPGRPKNDRPRWYREWKAPVCSQDPW